MTNWDTARNDGAITYKNDSMYALANAFMLAYDYGTPRLLTACIAGTVVLTLPPETVTVFEQSCTP